MGDYDNDDWEYPWPNTPKQLTTATDTAENSVFAQEAYNPDALKTLLNFCVNNRDLDKLESLIGAFNPFKILKIEDAEIRHSHVLAWLCDPTAHHGLGDTLFKNILLEILRDNRGADLPKIKDVMGASFTDIRVMREWRNIDIFALSQSNKIAVVIENKINAVEEGRQLAKYVDIVEKKYPDYKKVFVLLTLDGTAPRGSDRYIPFTHEQIHDIVSFVVELRRDYMNAKVYDFVQQYISVLEVKVMRQSAEFIEICGKLYREHKDAIRMITTYGKPKLPPRSIQDFHNRTDTESVHAGKDSVNVYYAYIPTAWNGKVPTTNKYTQDRYLVFFYWNFSEYENHKITLSLNIGNFPDSAERERFIELVSEAAKVDKDAKLTVRRSSKTNTTVFSKSISLKYGSGDDTDLDDYDAVVDKLVEAYTNPDTQRVLTIMDDVVQKFKFGFDFTEG